MADGTDWANLFERLDAGGEPTGISLTHRPYSYSDDEAIEIKRALFHAALFALWNDAYARDRGSKIIADQGRRGELGDIFNLSRTRLVQVAEQLVKSDDPDLTLALDTRKVEQFFGTNANFFDELLLYLLRPAVYLRRIKDVQSRIIEEVLPRYSDAQQIAEAAARLERTAALVDPLNELTMVISVTLAHYPLARQLLKEVDDQSKKAWADFYRQIVDEKGIRLREGVIIEDFTELAAMMTEGALVRGRVFDDLSSSVAPARAASAIGYLVRGMLAPEQVPHESTAERAGTRDLARYLRQIGFDGQVQKDRSMLFALQEGHLRSFAHSNLDLFGGFVNLSDPDYYLSNLLDHGHGGFCYQQNVALASILRRIGFDVEYLMGTVIASARISEHPVGDHLCLRVECEGRGWLVDVGMGDGPREPIPLVESQSKQDGFEYSLVLMDDDTWLFRHNRRGSFAELRIQRNPVELGAFDKPGRIPTATSDFGFSKTIQFIQRRRHETWQLRGLHLKVIEPNGQRVRRVGEFSEWLTLARGEFGIYFGNIPQAQREKLWRRICEADTETSYDA